jgi:two-component system response regulator
MALQPIEILLVEDDPADVKLTTRALQNNGLLSNVRAVYDGVEAMRFLRQQHEHCNAPRPDLVLLDLNMPRMDGREVLRAIKSDPHLRSIPVVIVTTSEAEQDIATSYLDAANSYITKPVDLHTFKKAVLTVKDYWFSVVKLPPKRRERQRAGR